MAGGVEMTGLAGAAGDADAKAAKAAGVTDAVDARANAAKTANVRDGVALALGLVIVVIGSTMPSGLYAIYQRDWGLSTDKTVVVFACYAVGVIVTLAYGHLSDSLGRKPIALTSMGLSLVSTLMFLAAALVDSHEAVLYLARIVSGFSVGLATGSFTALLQEKLLTQIGALTSTVAVSGALALGPLASAVVAQFSSSPLQMPYWIYAALTVMSMVGVARVRERSFERNSVSWRPQFGVARDVIRVFIPGALAIGCAYGVNGLFQSVVPLAAKDMGFDTQLKIASITALMLGVSAVTQVMLGRRAQRVSYPVGLVILALGLGGATVSLLSSNAVLLIIATVICGVGQGISFKYSLLRVSEAARGKDLAATVSSYYIVGYAGTAVGPLAAGLSGGSSAVVGIVCIAFAVLSVAVAVAGSRQTAKAVTATENTAAT
ncbi:hypothetical protein HMPREF2547_03455 [Corynebacterium sp. HMSC055G02]|nr:hypothetical protein HMPREF2681_07200 [Corynebacterium sp. HMSC064H12]OFN53885.1 hypothetical protein HMPREF2547_03455 [Corynebacterium sp. HMSC055G02]OFQ03630.1 hypothetical protein HMPREF2960_00685 [Corynebacterium sp. HMSC070B05]TXS81529.1 MFS transporter [Corynebacterium sp. LK12]